MPQMKPMNWLILFSSLNIILMIMNIKNYFIKNIMIKKTKMNFNLNNKNWMW